MTEPVEEKKVGWRPDGEDVIALIGLLLLVSGVFWIYRPAALIIAGAFLIWYSYILSGRPKETSGTR